MREESEGRQRSQRAQGGRPGRAGGKARTCCPSPSLEPISPPLRCTLRPLLYAHACCIWPLGARRAAKVSSGVRLGCRAPPIWPKGSGALRKRRRSRPIGESRPTGTTPHARPPLGGPPPRRSVGTTMSSCACRALGGLALLGLLGAVPGLRWHAITPRGSRGSGVCALPQLLAASGVLGPSSLEPAPPEPWPT